MNIGDRVKHPVYGEGTIVEFHDKLTTVDFSNPPGGRRAGPRMVPHAELIAAPTM